MGERLFDFDPLTGLKTTFRYNEENDSFALTYSQDVAPILDDNKTAQAEAFDKRADVWHAARVPDIVQLEWKTKFGVEMWNQDHKPAVLRLLDSSEYCHLKRAPITLGKGAGRMT